MVFSDSPEEVEDRLLTVEGKGFPSWLKNGALLRNGPGLFGTKERRYSHVFDGLAKLTRYSLIETENGEQKIKFSAKFIRSAMYKGIVEQKKIPPSVTTGPIKPDWSLTEGIWAAVNSKAFDNVPVNLHQLGGRKSGKWVGVTDAPIVVEFDPDTLSTKGRLEYGAAGNKSAEFKGARSDAKIGGYELFSTAHPKSTADGEGTLNYFLEAGLTTNTALMVKVNSDLERTIVGKVPLGFGQIPYVHEISLTADDKYAVLCIFPLNANPSKMANGRGFLPQLEWKGAEDGGSTLIHVFDLDAVSSAYGEGQSTPDLSPVASYEAPPQFAYHHVNCYATQDGSNQLVLDLSAYDSPDIISGEGAFAYVDVVKNAELRRKKMAKAAETYRYSLPLPGPGTRLHGSGSGPMKVQPEVLAAVDARGKRYDSELLRIHPERLGRPYRYSYGFTAYAGEGEREGNWLDWAVVKLDTHAAASGEAVTAKVWRQRGVFTSEPIFVPSPENHRRRGDDRAMRYKRDEKEEEEEDDGVLLVQAFDAARMDSFLLCLDARSMTELARAYTGLTCPISFHGQWVPSFSG